jgi:hypothetical protein
MPARQQGRLLRIGCNWEADSLRDPRGREMGRHTSVPVRFAELAEIPGPPRCWRILRLAHAGRPASKCGTEQPGPILRLRDQLTAAVGAAGGEAPRSASAQTRRQERTRPRRYRLFVKAEAAHRQSASSQAWQSSEAQTGVSHAAYRNSRNALSRYRRTPS